MDTVCPRSLLFNKGSCKKGILEVVGPLRGEGGLRPKTIKKNRTFVRTLLVFGRTTKKGTFFAAAISYITIHRYYIYINITTKMGLAHTVTELCISDFFVLCYLAV